MTHQYRNYTSLNKSSAPKRSKRFGISLSKPQLTRTYSSNDLHGYSRTSNLGLQSFRSTSNLNFPVDTRTITNYEDYKTKRRTTQTISYCSDTETSLKSCLDMKSRYGKFGSPGSSPSSTHSLARQDLPPNIAESVVTGNNYDYYSKSESLCSLGHDLMCSREAIRRSHSSTDLVSLVHSKKTRTPSDKPYQSKTLNRSLSYANLSKVTCNAGNKKGDYPQRVHSEKRSFNWTPIPTFEEFRKMRAQEKECSKDSQNGSVTRNHHSDKESTCETEDLTAKINFSLSQKKVSLSSNPVIQELLLKYGLSTDITVKSSSDSTSTTCSTTMDSTPVENEVTSSKRRLLNIVDDFLASRSKERLLTSNVNVRKSLREQRTLSSPQMTCFEGYQQLKVDKSEAGSEVANFGDKPCENKHETGKQDRETGNVENVSQRESTCYRKNNDNKQTTDESLEPVSKEACNKPRVRTRRTTNLEQAKDESKNLTNLTTLETKGAVVTVVTVEQAKTEISLPAPSLYVTSSYVPSYVTSLTDTSLSKVATSPVVFLREADISKSAEKGDRQKRDEGDESPLLNKESGESSKLKLEKDRALCDLPGRTSSLLSLTDSVTSYEDLCDVGMESLRNNRSVSRTGSSLSVDTADLGYSGWGRPLQSRRESYLSAVSGSGHSGNESKSSAMSSRGSSFVSNISNDSGSIHLEFSDEDGDVFCAEPAVFHVKTESEIKRNDSGLGDEIGVTSCRLKKRFEDIVDDSSRQWSIVASSARYWRDKTKKKKEKCLQQKTSDGKIVPGTKNDPSSMDCPDCGRQFLVDKDKPSAGPKQTMICYKCQRHRVERKEAIIELVHTEKNYGIPFPDENWWNCLSGEFDENFLKHPTIFKKFTEANGRYAATITQYLKIYQSSNVIITMELLDVSTKFCKRIQASMQECIRKNDEEFSHMEVGKIFVENVEFFQAYELYCSKQPDAISVLESLQKKNEVLKVFLNVTCRENPKCRKMDINSFLFAPVQRVMKYPLLLSRIRKTTPHWHTDREDLKIAQRKVEDQIAKINSLTKSSEIKTKRFHSDLGTSVSVDSQRLKKLACDVLNWTSDEIQLLMHDILKVSCWEFGAMQSWTKRVLGRNIEIHLLFCIRGHNEPIRVDTDDDDILHFPGISEVSDASLLLLKRKSNGKYTLFRDEIKLRDCVVYKEEENDVFGLIQMGKEAFVFTAKTTKDARRWLKHLRLQTINQGKWRQRRNASANIMLKTS